MRSWPRSPRPARSTCSATRGRRSSRSSTRSAAASSSTSRACTRAIAVGAADGYARVSRRAGVVQLHTAAGVGNAAGMLGNANVGGTPLVVYVGCPARADAYAEPVLGGDPVAVAAPVSKWAWELRTADEIPAVVARAFKVALTPPFGPGRARRGDGRDGGAVCSPGRWRRASCVRRVPTRTRSAKPPRMLDPREPAGDRRRRRRRGRGRRGRRGRGAARRGGLRGRHRGGRRACRAAPSLRHGRGRGDARRARRRARGGHAVPAPRRPHVSTAARRGNGARARRLRSVGARQEPSRRSRSWPTSGRRCASSRPQLERAGWSRTTHTFGRDTVVVGTGFDADVALEQLAAVLPEDAIVVDESVSAIPALQRQIPMRPGAWFRSRGGALGAGMSMPIGAALAAPDRPVVAIVGDGSAMYTAAALWTLANRGLRVTVVILDNGGYGILDDVRPRRRPRAGRHPARRAAHRLLGARPRARRRRAPRRHAATRRPPRSPPALAETPSLVHVVLDEGAP